MATIIRKRLRPGYFTQVQASLLPPETRKKSSGPAAEVVVPGPGVCPTIISPPGTPEFWFDGEDIDGIENTTLIPGDAIAVWKNKGYNNIREITQVIAGMRPVYSISEFGFRGATFDPAFQQSLSATLGAIQGQPFLMAVLARADDVTNRVAVSSNATDSQYLGTQSASYENWGGGGSVSIKGPTASVDVDRVQIATLLSDGTSSIVQVDWREPGETDSGIFGFAGPRVGNKGLTDAFGFSGEVFQVLVYYGTNVTHADIVQWVETCYCETVPFLAATLPPVTPLPPGTPEFWFDGNDIDGLANSTLIDGSTFTEWKSKGTNTTPATVPAGLDAPFYYISPAGYKAGRSLIGSSQESMRVASGTLAQPFMIAVVMLNASDDGINMASAGSYGAAPSPRIGVRHSGFGNSWNMAGGATEFSGGSRNKTKIQVGSGLFNGASSILGIDHQADVNGATEGTSQTGVALFGANTNFSPNGDGSNIYQVLVYPNAAVTHAQIVAWAETVYGGTAPFTP
jgi:hypothetical protein